MDLDVDAAIAAGLYDPDAPGADDRLALLEHLAAAGATIDEMATADRDGNITSVLLDRRMRSGELSARQLAEGAGITVEEVVEGYRLMGIAIDDPAQPRFDAEEVRLVELLAIARAGLPEDMPDEILRSIGSGMRGIAESAVSAFVGTVEDELVDRNPIERTDATTGIGEIGLELGTLLGPLLRHHLWLATQRQREAMVGAASRRESTVAVGFVDLVGYTSATAAMTPDALLAFIQHFHRQTFDLVTAGGGRIIKHIGDEIMFSAHRADQACEIALALVDGFDTEASLPRGGLAHGMVIARHGDLYGPTVNLAARLTDVAVPGEVLADAAVAAAVAPGERLVFEPGGRRQLKGFDAPVSVVSVLRAESGADDGDADVGGSAG